MTLDTLALKTEASYRLNLRAAARALWLGEFNWYDFYISAVAAIDRGFRQAWEEGAKTEGILPDELSSSELQQLEREINHERAYVEGLADFIESQSRANGGKLVTVNQRVERWINTYSRVKQLAAVTAAKDKKKRWTTHPAEHCADCLALEGKVKRASYWREHITPKDWSLRCKNGCKCTLEDTDEPLSRGPLPAGF